MDLNLRKELPKKLGIKYAQLEDIICTGVEGGSISYWGIWDNTTAEYKQVKEAMKVAQIGEDGDDYRYPTYVFTMMLRNNITCLIEDCEEDASHGLTLDNLVKVIYEYTLTHKVGIDDFDACDVDVIIQKAIFGEVVYG